MARSIIVVCLFFLTLTPLTAQDATPPEPSADSKVVGSVAGKPITEAEFALELAARYRDHELGRSLIQDYRDRFLVDQSARTLGVEVSAADVDAEYRAIDTRLKKETQGQQSLDQVLAKKNTDIAEFRSYLHRLVLVRKIVRAERKLAADAEVTDDAVREWLKSRAKAATVVTDPADLPPETVLTIGESKLTLARFGAEILATLNLKDRARELNRTLNERVVATAMDAKHLAITAGDLDAAIARERQRYAENPQTQAVAYEAILKQLGTTIEKRKHDPNFRANIALRKIAEAHYTDDQLEAYYTANQDRLGPTVRVRHIFARVKDSKNPFSTGSTEDEAQKRILALRAAVIGGKKFEKVARMKSDDRSRFRGGEIGFIYRSGRMDPAFSEAAFALEVGAVSPPVRSSAGFHLIQVIEKRPAAPFAEVREKVLRARARAWFQEAVRAAEVQNTYLDRLKANEEASAKEAAPAAPARGK